MRNIKYQLISPINEDNTPIEQIFINRGFYKENVDKFLNTSEDDVLPLHLIENIDEGAKLLIKHLRDGCIYVPVDADCDGFTSAAIFLNYLYQIVPTIAQNIVYDFHEEKHHGIILNRVPANTTLVVAIDSSSNEYEIHKILKERGIDVLVIDHHEAEYASKDACVINNQLDEYPTKSLSGAGMVFKFCQYLDTVFKVDYADRFRDLTATGLIADMMDQRDRETFQLITTGIQQIQNPFLKAMTERNAYSLGEEITPIGIAFYVAPYINCINRVGTVEEKRLLFESMLEWKAYEEIPSTKRGCAGSYETLVEQAVRTCTNVKKKQTDVQDEGVDLVESIIADKELYNNSIILVKLNKDCTFDQGITGLIANKLMAKYTRPVAVLREKENEEGQKCWEGSARGCEKTAITNFRKFCTDSGLTYLQAGHANAFGLGILDENIPAFVKLVNDTIPIETLEPIYQVDFIFNPNEMFGKTFGDIVSLKKYWGQNIKEPLVAIENVSITSANLTLMSPDKRPTLKVTLSNGIELIKFKSSQQEYEMFYSETGNVMANFVGTCDINVFRDRITYQLKIVDYEIVSRNKYYF